MECPECGGAVWVNYKTGKRICGECGIVISDLDFEQTKSNENRDNHEQD